MGHGGGLPLGSAFLGIAGLWKLARMRKYRAFVLCLLLIAGPPIAFAVIMHIPDRDTRMWFGIPLAMLSPFWLMSGLWVDATAKDYERNMWKAEAAKRQMNSLNG